MLGSRIALGGHKSGCKKFKDRHKDMSTTFKYVFKNYFNDVL